MEINQANLTDIPQLCILLDALFSQEAEFKPNHELQGRGLSNILNNEEIGVILVARDSDKVIGMVSILYTVSTALGERVGMLEDFVVLPKYRCKGVGSGLLSYALNFSKQKGCKRITLLTDGDNEHAHRLYLRFGFSRSPMVPFRLSLDT
tara:strand:- start:76 stop:525 length:450 start_codon:yes stop_codon:yes gene_type:complete